MSLKVAKGYARLRNQRELFVVVLASIKRFAVRGFAIVALSGGLVLSPAQATTWGHLNGPFAYESQVRELLSFAAERREERRWGRVTASVGPQFFVRYGRPPICAGVPQHCVFD
jgi:hypothetical protein